MSAPDWHAVRAEFPALAGRTYLNTATYGQMPRRAAEAAAQHFLRRDDRACVDFLAWYDDMDRLRERLAKLVNCQAADLAFIPNAAAGLAILMAGIQWRSGDRVVTLAGEFPNNLYIPALLQRHGAELVETEWESFEDAIVRGARLAVLSTANYTNGFRPPLEEISRLCRQQGTLLYLDGTQSVGALTTDLSRVQPGLMAVHGYKWMLSPNGAGFLYVSPEVREWLEPNVVGWRSDSGWRQVDYLSHGAPIFMNSAEKYEGGGLNFPSLYAMDVSVQMMLDLGPAVIERRVLELAGLVRDSLRRLGATLAADSSPYFDSPIVAARFTGRDASEIARALAARGVIVSARHGNLRVSTHFYNTAEDVAQLAKGLAELL